MQYPENYDEIMEAGLDLDAVAQAVEDAKAVAIQRFGSLPVLVALPSNVKPAIDLVEARTGKTLVDASKANTMLLSEGRMQYRGISQAGTISGIPLTYIFNASQAFVVLKHSRPELPFPPEDSDLIYPVPLSPLSRA